MIDKIETKNATIENVDLFIEDHGTLTAYLYLDYGGSGQGFGGYALYLPSHYTHSKNNKNYAGHFLYKILKIVGVSSWKDLKGKSIRVMADYEKIHAIGHIIEDKWFNPTEDFKKMKETGV